MKTKLFSAAAAALMTTMFAGGAIAGASDNTMRVAFAEEMLNLDYNYTTKREYIILSDLIDEGLFDYDPAANAYVPSVASGWDYTSPTTIVVTIREGVTFHDGSPLTAEDVAYTYNFIISEQSESKAKGTIGRWLMNAKVVDDLTVQFNMAQPYPLAVRDMANRVQLRKAGSYDEDQKALATTHVGLGPYKVESFEPGKEIVLSAYDGYFAESPKQPISVGNIVIRNLPDAGTQQAELMAGGIDWMFKVSRDVAEAMGAAPNVDHVVSTDLRIGFLVLDSVGHTDAEGPLTDVRVRQAMNHAINKGEIAEFLMGGGAQPVHTACHPSQFGCDQSVANYAYDTEKAKALLAEAGYADGFDLELWSYRDKAIAEAVVSDLTKAGINVSLRHVKLASLNEARANRDIQAYFGTWGSGGTPDTAAIARVHFSEESDRNMSKNPEVTALILAAEQTSDQAERAELYTKALSIIAEEAYWVPMVSYAQNFLVSSELNFTVYSDGLPRLYRASWK